MANKAKIAVVLLRLPDGRLIFQRRGPTAPTSPNLLGLFGGHVEPNEHPDDAVRRELSEETSLDISKLSFKKLDEAEIDDFRHFYYYISDVNNVDFEVFEGEGLEVYSPAEAASRNDITPSTRKSLEIING
jgi:8-oxo-dGTP pyrophosphatase MutT (NUDIX family)